ncbi:MAG: cytochrome c biogenesis protein, partial [Bdellovibrionota bacterium]
REEIEKKYSCSLSLRVDHIKTKAALGIEAGERSVAPSLAWIKKDDLLELYHQESQKESKDDKYLTDLSNLLERIKLLSEIEDGSDWKVPSGNGAFETMKALRAKGEENLVFTAATKISPSEAKSAAFESVYEKLKPFSWALALAVLGFLCSILSVKNEAFSGLALALLAALFLLELTGIGLRIFISGRAPVTNMYETVMWSGFCLFTLASILGIRLKNRKVWAVGFAGNALFLLMMNFATGMLDATIQPLVPVLRDNFWLSTHVTSVTISYACFALSWLMSNYVMARFIVKPKLSGPFIDDWNYVIRISMQVGTVFLACGVILGGIWADYSWGRFWGWDPKETCSLVALIVYMAILHGRYAGWFKGVNFALMGGVGFLFVLMAWFGVNYILAVGLHSYGFSSGGALFLAVVLLAQLTMLGTTYLRQRFAVSQ